VIPGLHTTLALFLWTAVLAFANSIFGPAASGLVSVFAGPAEQGTVLGAAQAMSALGRLLGPFLIGLVYDRSHAAAFLAAGAVMAVGGLVTLKVPKAEPRPTQVAEAEAAS
jgi:MFS family permease